MNLIFFFFFVRHTNLNTLAASNGGALSIDGVLSSMNSHITEKFDAFPEGLTSKKPRILVCAPSNGAVDEVCLESL